MGKAKGLAGLVGMLMVVGAGLGIAYDGRNNPDYTQVGAGLTLALAGAIAGGNISGRAYDGK